VKPSELPHLLLTESDNFEITKVLTLSVTVHYSYAGTANFGDCENEVIAQLQLKTVAVMSCDF